MYSFLIISLLYGIAAAQQTIDGQGSCSCSGALGIDFQWGGVEAKLDDIIASIGAQALDPEWQLVFKAVSGIAPTDSTDQERIDPYYVWSRDEPLNENVPAARQLDTTFQGHYKSSFALNWERRNIKEVKVAYMDSTGTELMTMVFDAEGSDRDNWFTKDRVLSSPYDDMISEPHPHIFSTVGDTNHNRRFFINRSYGGCGVDAGWAIVVGKNPPPCSWEHPSTAKPTFLYSNKRTVITWSNVGDVGQADLFAIFVRTKSRYR
ncbi:uncharacterized protein [Amphiura filiformis]|uniref:uncharacterized protein n=1 Tax=Amphiura filiformis TaxID=82378 RepID=UPI003B22578E